jgi:MFS family permease
VAHAESSPDSGPSPGPDSGSAERTLACPLDSAAQRRNLVLFACCTGLIYLAAPVLYVGITQASLCNKLGADARTSNLPGTLFFAMTAAPALMAWLSPQVRTLLRNLSLCYFVSGAMLLTIALTLLADVPVAVKLAVVILQGGVSGATMPTAIALLWEVIGRGSDESKRGWALSLAFGAGPLLAVAGSFAQTALLGGQFFGWTLPGVEYPKNFAILFGAGAPVMMLAAWLARRFNVPPALVEPTREPARQVLGLLLGLPALFAAVALTHAATVAESEVLRWLGWLSAAVAAVAIIHHFRSVLSQRTLLLATIVTLLVYAGNMIPTNMNLYSSVALGGDPDKYAGVQNMLRFGFKVVAGAALGQLLTRTSPRAGLLATSLIYVVAPLWAATVTGPWYLLAFGIFGAGELVGVYSPNYLVSASRSSDLRRNMAFMTMMMVPAAPAGYLYGSIVDLAQRQGWTWAGMDSVTLGFRLSFLVCSLFVMSGIICTLVLLPRHPKPPVE